MENKFYVISFENTHTAMVAQKLLKPNLKFQVIPTLREITLSCGISIMLENISQDAAISAVRALALEDNLYKLFAVTKQNGKTEIEELL